MELSCSSPKNPDSGRLVELGGNPRGLGPQCALGQRICHNIPIRSMNICATKSTISSPSRKQNRAVTLVLLCAVCVQCSAPHVPAQGSEQPSQGLHIPYMFLPYSFPYPTHQALWAKSRAVSSPRGFFHPSCAHLYLLSVPVAKAIATVATLP